MDDVHKQMKTQQGAQCDRRQLTSVMDGANKLVQQEDDGCKFSFVGVLRQSRNIDWVKSITTAGEQEEIAQRAPEGC